MSSATSIDPSSKLGTGPSRGRSAKAVATGTEKPPADDNLRPWQFFVLAGMLAATAVVVVATGQSPAAIIVLSLTVVSTSLVALGVYRALVPLVSRDMTSAPALVAGRTRAALEREKTLVLRSIKELEFDFAMGKVSRGDFDEMVGRLRARAIGLMRQLDEGGGYTRAIEHELKRRMGQSPTVAAATAPPATSAPAPAGEVAPIVTSPACASCGVSNDLDARFCKHCGTKLSTE